MLLTCLLDVNFANVLKFPDGNVKCTESACPADASTAVNHNRWTQLMSSPGRRHGRGHLSLLLSHTLQQQY